MSVEEIDQDRFAEAHETGVFVLDVREPHEYEAGHVPGAVNVPLGELPSRAAELAARDTVYVVCLSGARSLDGAALLERAGIPAVSVAGGTKDWHGAGRPVTPGPLP